MYLVTGITACPFADAGVNRLRETRAEICRTQTGGQRQLAAACEWNSPACLKLLREAAGREPPGKPVFDDRLDARRRAGCKRKAIQYQPLNVQPDGAGFGFRIPGFRFPVHIQPFVSASVSGFSSLAYSVRAARSRWAMRTG